MKSQIKFAFAIMILVGFALGYSIGTHEAAQACLQEVGR